jgi:Acyl-CoA carboxylase epsilon subunit
VTVTGPGRPGGQSDRGGRDDGDDGGDQRDPPASGLTLEVVAGHPSADELAALTVALAAALAASDRRAGPGEAGRRGGASSVWADRAAMVSAPLMPGPDAWRRSARPGRAGRLG